MSVALNCATRRWEVGGRMISDLCEKRVLCCLYAQETEVGRILEEHEQRH